MVKLNNKGFSFHIVLPILALLAVGSIGAFMTFKSNAYVPPQGWKTIKSVTGTWKIYPNKSANITSASIKAVSGVKYRQCAVMRYSTGSNTVVLFAQPTSSATGAYSRWIDGVGTTYSTRCGQSWRLAGGYTYYASPWNPDRTGYATITKIFWQRYY